MKLKNLILSAASASFALITASCFQPMIGENPEVIEELLKADATEISDMNIRQLMDKMQKANDPKGKFRNAKSYIMRQSIISELEAEKSRISQEYVSEVKFKAPNLLRQTSYRSGKPFKTIISHDTEAWNVDPETGRSKAIPEGTPLNLTRTFNAMLNPAKNYLDIFPTVELSIVYEDENKYYRIVCRAEDPNIAPYVIYVDTKTFLTVKAKTILYANDGATYIYEATSMDYTWVDDVCMPGKIVIKTNNTVDTSTIINFVINPDIPDSEFELPKPFQVDL